MFLKCNVLRHEIIIFGIHMYVTCSKNKLHSGLCLMFSLDLLTLCFPLIRMAHPVFFRTSTRKGIPMKRTKNVRKMKAVAKAIALSEKYEEKATKDKTKTLRTLSAKKLYE